MFLVLSLYLIVVLFFIVGVIRLPNTKIDKKLAKKKFSILIPFRNEEESLTPLLNSIRNLDYNIDDFEVLMIDDESCDNSVSIINKWKKDIPNIQLFKNKRRSNSPKKDAIQVGIKNSNFDFIISTDADCILPENWLHTYNTSIQKNNSLFIAGPIALKTNKTFLEQYQKHDNISLIGSTMGSFGIKKPIMCNAANMGFDKETYLNIKPKNDDITSGDDIFTLEKFVKTHPKKVHFLNTSEALIITKPETSWQNVINQRIRWAAKSTHYTNLYTKLIGLIVLTTQLSIVFGLILIPIKTLIFWVFKICVDFVLIKYTSHKTKQEVNINQYVTTAIYYPFLNTYIGVRSLFGGYIWKGRNFKR